MADSSPISVYVAHLKSKRPTDIYREGWYRNNSDVYKKHAIGFGYAKSTIRRSSEAVAIRMLLTDELKNINTPLVILGDFNDGQLSNTLSILTKQPNYLLSGLNGRSDNGLYTVRTLQEY